MILKLSAKIFLILVLLTAAAFLTFNAPAKADLMTYDYTGNPFTVTSDPDLGTRVTGSVQVDIPADFTGNVPAASFLSWSLTTGTLTITPSNNLMFNNGGLDFSNGQVSTWSWIVYSLDPGGKFSNFYIQTYSDGPGSELDGVSGYINNWVYANIYYSPGTWTRAPQTPLPAAALLFGSGLLGLGLARLRSKKAQAILS